MAAYVIVDVGVHDADAYRDYQAIVPIRQRNATTNFLTLVEGV